MKTATRTTTTKRKPAPTDAPPAGNDPAPGELIVKRFRRVIRLERQTIGGTEFLASLHPQDERIAYQLAHRFQRYPGLVKALQDLLYSSESSLQEAARFAISELKKAKAGEL